MVKNKNILVNGVGVNDADYSVVVSKIIDGVSVVVFRCPYYTKWRSVLERCYGKKLKSIRPTYEGCTVCKEWLYFSKFKAWMETQDWEGKHLDKDILVEGNKHYSPETCVFVSHELNCFVLSKDTSKRGLPTGVYLKKVTGKYVATGSDGPRSVYLGYYNTVEEAHRAWVEYKIQRVYEFKENGLEDKVVDALLLRYNSILATLNRSNP